MNKIYFLAFLLILNSCTSENHELLDFETEFNKITKTLNDSIKCKIEIVSEYKEKYTLGIFPHGNSLISRTLSVLDSNDNPIELFYYYNEGYFKEDHHGNYTKVKIENFYDGKNNLIEQKLFFVTNGIYSSNNYVIDIYKYDEKNNVIEYSRNDTNYNPRFIERAEFDKNNMKISETLLDSYKDSLKVRSAIYYEYIDSVSSRYCLIRNTKQAVVSKKQIIYSDNGKLNSEIFHNLKENSKFKIIYEYSNTGMVKSRFDIFSLFGIEFEIKTEVDETKTVITNM